MILDKLKNLSTREQIALAAGVMCAFVWLVDLLVVRPISKAVVRYDREIRQSRAALAYGETVLAARQEVAAAYEKVSALLPKPASSAQAQDEMKSEVDGLLTQSGVEFKSMEDRAPKKCLYHDEYMVEVGGVDTEVTNLLKLMELVHQARTAPGMLRVVKLNLTPGKGNLRVKGSMTISRAMRSADDKS